MLLPLPIVSLRSANTKAFGIAAPRRLSMIALGIATTSALTVRVHCACIGGAGLVVVPATGALAGVVVSGFANSGSALGDSVAGLAVSSLAGAPTFCAGVETGAVTSATGLFRAVAGVCAPAVTAVSKQKVNTVNEVTTGTGD